jgi:hypothetical protein
MKKLLIALLFTTPAYADISVCVNSTTGKARFATVCSKKETQQFLQMGGEAPGDVKSISKKVIVPKGTVPGYRATEYPYTVTLNFPASIGCSDQEIYLESKMKVLGAEPDNFCSAYGGGNFETGDTGIQVLCGGGNYAIFSMDQNIEPTTRDITLYLVASCIKK